MNVQRVLVVDDEKALCGVLKDLLEIEGYVVDVCHDVQAAKDKLAAFRYDAAMVDVFLSEAPIGLALGQHIAVRYPETGLILMTGYAEDCDIRQGYISGAYACIRKPFQLDDVVRVVATVIGEKAEKSAA